MKAEYRSEIRQLAQKITQQLKGEYCHFPLAVDPLILAGVLDKTLGIYDEPGREVASDIAVIGSTIELLERADSSTFSVQLTLPGAADPSQGKISVLSPIGLALFGTRTGEQITLWVGNRATRFNVEHIKPE